MRIKTELSKEECLKRIFELEKNHDGVNSTKILDNSFKLIFKGNFFSNIIVTGSIYSMSEDITFIECKIKFLFKKKFIPYLIIPSAIFSILAAFFQQGFINKLSVFSYFFAIIYGTTLFWLYIMYIFRGWIRRFSTKDRIYNLLEICTMGKIIDQ